MTRAPLRGPTPRQAVWLAAAAGAVVTLISLLPITSVAYRSSALHLAIETAATLIGLLAAVLLIGRFMRAPMRPDVVLAGSLLMLGLTNLFFAVIPWIADEQPGSFDTWAPIMGRLIGAAGLAAGALMLPVPVLRPRRSLSIALAAVGAAMLAIAVLGAVLAPSLPIGIDPGLPPDPAGPDLVGEPAVLVTQVVAMALYATAAAGLLRRSERTADELMAWLAAAATLAAFSRLNYFLFPSLYSEWVYAGDFLRLGFFGVILVGALREIMAYQRELSEMAVHRERRRIARELHDGLAQELAYIASQARHLAAREDDLPAQIADSAGRALDESRQAIATLARPADASLDASVAQAVDEIAGRHRLQVKLDLAPGLRAPDRVHDALMRIVREAVHNAARHGRAGAVSVELEASDGLRLTVEDDGEGLPGDDRGGAGFGLVSMRERAEALGGRVEIGPGGKRGVRVEVWLP